MTYSILINQLNSAKTKLWLHICCTLEYCPALDCSVFVCCTEFIKPSQFTGTVWTIWVTHLVIIQAYYLPFLKHAHTIPSFFKHTHTRTHACNTFLFETHAHTCTQYLPFLNTRTHTCMQYLLFLKHTRTRAHVRNTFLFWNAARTNARNTFLFWNTHTCTQYLPFFETHMRAHTHACNTFLFWNARAHKCTQYLPFLKHTHMHAIPSFFETHTRAHTHACNTFLFLNTHTRTHKCTQYLPFLKHTRAHMHANTFVFWNTHTRAHTHARNTFLFLNTRAHTHACNTFLFWNPRAHTNARNTFLFWNTHARAHTCTQYLPFLKHTCTQYLPFLNTHARAHTCTQYLPFLKHTCTQYLPFLKRACTHARNTFLFWNTRAHAHTARARARFGKTQPEMLLHLWKLNISKAISFPCSSWHTCAAAVSEMLLCLYLNALHTSFTAVFTPSPASFWLKVSLFLLSAAPLFPSLDLYNHMICAFTGWYEDWVFHVNAFGFPPTEPSSFTRCSLASIDCNMKRVAGFVLHPHRASRLCPGLLWQCKLLWRAVQHCGQSLGQTEAAGGGERGRHVCVRVRRVAGQCGGSGEDTNHVLRSSDSSNTF